MVIGCMHGDSPLKGCWLTQWGESGVSWGISKVPMSLAVGGCSETVQAEYPVYHCAVVQSLSAAAVMLSQFTTLMVVVLLLRVDSKCD